MVGVFWNIATVIVTEYIVSLCNSVIVISPPFFLRKYQQTMDISCGMCPTITPLFRIAIYREVILNIADLTLNQ